MTKIPANPPEDASLSPHAWASAETQKALWYGHVINQFSVAPLVESIHMLFEQITLDDDSRMTIKLASRIMLRLYASVGSDADTALTLLEIGTKCLALDPESFGERAVEVVIDPPNICPGKAREWLYDEVMATEDTKDQIFMREDRIHSENKRKEPRASGTDRRSGGSESGASRRVSHRETPRDSQSKGGSTPQDPNSKSPTPRRSLLRVGKLE